MRAQLSSISLKTAGEIIHPSTNVTLIVGPNNVGKSAALAQVHQRLTTESGQTAYSSPGPVSTTNLSIPQNPEYLAELYGRATRYEAGTYPHGTYYEPTYRFPNSNVVTESYIRTTLARSDSFGQFASSVVAFLGPEGRGGVLAPQGLPDLLLEPGMSTMGRSPMQMLWADRTLEATLNSYMQRAFGKALLVNRHAGANVYVHVGRVDIDEPRIGDSSAYLDAVKSLPQLSAQGAGMQAFMGTILTLAAGRFDIVLLDEPEAFLHPPQARLLGEVVAEMSRNGGPQVIASTHSDDFLRGVIGASRDDSDAAVVRLTRPTDEVNRVAQIDSEVLKTLYRDPLLRYSNIIEGIFYKGVTLCEAEADCTYYSVTLSHLEQSMSLNSTDMLFTHCGGKDRLERAYRALAAAAVPTAVIADIDLLADKAKFASLFDAMGGSFADLQSDFNVLQASVTSQRVEVLRADARAEVIRLFDQSNTKTLSKQEVSAMVNAFRSDTGWKQLKRKGAGAIDSGNPTSAFQRITAACRARGLFLVEAGELERFHPEVSGNKQQWLRTVLENEMFRRSPAGQSLVEGVREFIASNQ